MNNWKTVEFGSILDGGTRNGIYKQKQFHGSGFKIVNMRELFAYPRLKDVPMSRVQLSDAEAARFTLQVGDLLFARRSLVAEGAGKCSIVCEVKEPLTFESSIIRARPNQVISDSTYLYYMFNSPVGAYLLGTILRQVAVSGITGSDLVKLEIPLPPLPEQRAIAAILGALDDKIELNRAMNTTIEELARTMFREMIRVEGHNCRRGSILELANLLSGGTPSTSEPTYWNGNIDWVSARDVGNVNGIFLLDTEKKITQKGVDNSNARFLPENTTIVTARGTVGAFCMLGKTMTINQSNYGLKAKEGISDYYIYFTLSEMVEQLKQHSYGTIFDTITTRTFQSAVCVHPRREAIIIFESRVAPLFTAILNNQKQSRTLAQLRDALLPKLMRGEVKILNGKNNPRIH
jgi:type I restriction enzyme S subunit